MDHSLLARSAVWFDKNDLDNLNDKLTEWSKFWDSSSWYALYMILISKIYLRIVNFNELF